MNRQCPCAIHSLLRHSKINPNITLEPSAALTSHFNVHFLLLIRWFDTLIHGILLWSMAIVRLNKHIWDWDKFSAVLKCDNISHCGNHLVLHSNQLRRFLSSIYQISDSPRLIVYIYDFKVHQLVTDCRLQ